MKEFVIKNKEGNYDDGWENWGDDIRYACVYPSKETAKIYCKEQKYENNCLGSQFYTPSGRRKQSAEKSIGVGVRRYKFV